MTIAQRGATAQVVLRGSRDDGARPARRDIAFQDRDEMPERWATLGLVIAALVTLEERGAPPGDREAAPPARDDLARAVATPAAPIVATTVAVPAHEVPARARGGPDIHAALTGVAATGPLPGVAFGARAEAGLDWTRAALVLRLAYYPEHNRATVAVASGSGGGAFSLWAVAAGGCARSRATRTLALRACAGGAVASTAATGFGVASVETTRASTTTLWGGVGLQLAVTRRLALVAEPELTVALRRPSYAIRGAGTVFTPTRVGGGVSLGLVAAF